jgi:F-type H+-transporting ATPase subunit gamma
LAGAYSSAVIKEAERLTEKLHAEGKEVSLFVSGRKGIGYYSFRRRPIVRSWQGFSDNPHYDNAREIADTVISAYMAGHTDTDVEQPDAEGEDGTAPVQQIDELHVVFTRFRSMLVQQPDVIRMMPLEVVEAEEEPEEEEVLPLYEFEPSPDDVLDALLPRYVESRLFFCLMQAAASELAARQRAMKSATDNAQDLIEKYTRIANQARQAGITQEISEIVGSANALADASAGSE